MRPHPSRLSRTIYCVGPGRLVRELSPLLENAVKVRWTADASALSRTLSRDVHPGENLVSAPYACIIDEADLDRAARLLDEIRRLAPKARRLSVVDACNAEVIRRLIEPGLAQSLLYRPFELHEVRSAAGLSVLGRLSNGSSSAGRAVTRP